MTDQAAPMTYASAMANIKATMQAQPDPARTDLINALKWLEPAIEAEIAGAVAAYTAKVPIVGGLIANAVNTAVDTALREVLADLTT